MCATGTQAGAPLARATETALGQRLQELSAVRVLDDAGHDAGVGHAAALQVVVGDRQRGVDLLVRGLVERSLPHVAIVEAARTPHAADQNLIGCATAKKEAAGSAAESGRTRQRRRGPWRWAW